jgi:multidrug efflux pump subunit AcrA (membrane-fusion protein)
MKPSRVLLWLVLLGVPIGAAVVTRHSWRPLLQKRVPPPHAADEGEKPKEKPRILELSPQARQNLGLVARPAKLQSYWRTVQIPGEIADRAGVSDRGVTSPAVGVVTQVHAFAGDTIREGQPLFTLRLFSEYLQNTQSELFRAVRETELVQNQVDRLQDAIRSGAIPEAKAIELQNQLKRQNALITAYRQDLLTRGLRPEQIAEVSEGRFVSTIEVVAPPAVAVRAGAAAVEPVSQELVSTKPDHLLYEVEKLAVELGQQVQAGQLLATLSNHQSLYVVGHAFKPEASALERAAQEHRPIAIEFADDDPARDWPALDQTFEIRHLANTIDPRSRTFDFFVPLTNQSRDYRKGNETFLVWRFRPGQRARLHVPVEEFRDVYVIPAAGVVREGPEAYVFRQNGDLFDRRPVHVLYEDRQSAVIANDGNVTAGMYLAQSAAASLNRVLKAQAASGEQPGLHVHPDGTVHAAH